jgi:hypothetical protein
MASARAAPANAPFLPASGSTVEAQKTEPDKNTYLVLDGVHGADPGYVYGSHFLYQGHEATATGVPAAITRINLDADGAHRVTLLATQTQAGVPLDYIDGSTWDPWAKRLLFTTESKDTGGASPQPTPSVHQAAPDYPSRVDDVSNVIGRAGFEGIQNDDCGNLYLVEDIGGAAGTGANANTKQPNSFVYRFLPNDPTDLARGGKLQALQVTVDGTPLSTRPGTSNSTTTAPRGRPGGSPSRPRARRPPFPAPTTTRSRRPPERPRSSAPRTASSVPAPGSPNSGSTRPATPTTAPGPPASPRSRTAPARRSRAGLGRSSS